MWHSKYNNLTTTEYILLYWILAAILLSVEMYIILSIDKKRFLSLKEFIVLVSRHTIVNPIIIYLLSPIFSILGFFSVLAKVLEVIRNYINEYLSKSKLP